MSALLNRKRANAFSTMTATIQQVLYFISMMYRHLWVDHAGKGEGNWDFYILGRIHAFVHHIVSTNDMAYREIQPHERQPHSKRKEAQFCKASTLADEAYELTNKLINIPDGYVIHPYLNSYMQGIKTLADQQLFFVTTFIDNQEISRKEQINLLICTIREQLQQKDVKLKADLVLLREKHAIRSLGRYLNRIVNDAKTHHQSLLVMRLDLAYNPLFHAEINPTRIFRDVNTLLNVRRHRRIFDCLTGYVCIPFYGDASGPYAHLTLIFDQTQMINKDDIQFSLDLLWSNITHQKGVIYPCNLHEQNWKHVCQGQFSTYEFKQLELLKDALAHLYRTAHLMPPHAFTHRRMLRTGKFKPQTHHNALSWEIDHE